MNQFFIFFIFLLWISNCDNFSYSKQRKEIWSVVGSMGQLPCYVDGIDEVAMILWFKESSGTPIYSYDGRNENEAPRHLPLKNDFGLRLHFRVPSKTSSSSSPSSRPPALLIRNLKPTDGGLYRCRIDYRNSPTTNSVIRLNVIQPPTHLEIQDASDSRPISDQEILSPDRLDPNSANDITYMGPYVEGQNVTIVCTAFGGTPLPEVIWYRNGLLIDWSYDVVRNESVINTLTIKSLDRSHSHDVYSCQASNNNETKPISHKVNVDVYSTVKHIEVEIPDQLTAGAQYNLRCLTQGAYPAVKLEFWKLQSRLGPRYQTKSDEENVTVYTVQFRPEVSDNEAFVTCKAENPWISQNFMEAGRKLNVVYSPVVILRFGSAKRLNFSEGESVLLECHVKANPPLNSITWFHEGKELFDDVSGGIRLNGMTLILRHLISSSGGSYACEVSNDVGKGLSNTIHLQLNISPKCSTGVEKVIPLAIGETHQLGCDILAWPPDLNFYWTLNRSGDILPMSSLSQIIKLNLSRDDLEQTSTAAPHPWFPEPKTLRQKTKPLNLVLPKLTTTNFGNETTEMRRSRWKENDFKFDRTFHQSTLSYKIHSESDYGLVGCWAKNSYGKQIFPCLFRIIKRDSIGGRLSSLVKIEDEVEVTGTNKEKSDKDLSPIFHKVEGNTHFNKLNQTAQLILMGALIFITAFCIFGFTFWFFRVKQRTAAAASTAETLSPNSP